METPRIIRSGWSLAIGTLVLGLLLVAGVWFAASRLEGEPPSVVLEIPSPYHIGKSAEFSLRLEDPKSGLRRMAVVLSKDGKEIALAAADFPAAGWLGLEKVHRETAKIKIDPAALGLTDGQGTAAGDGRWTVPGATGGTATLPRSRKRSSSIPGRRSSTS